MTPGQVTQAAAAQIGEGYRIVQPGGTATAPVMTVQWTDAEGELADDRDSPVRAVLALDDGDELELPGDTMLSVIRHADATDVPLTRRESWVTTPIRSSPCCAESPTCTPATWKLSASQPGCPGSHDPVGLEGVARRAATLYLRLEDSRHALPVCALISGEQFRGDRDPWTWIGQTLALTNHLALAAGDAVLAANCRNGLAVNPHTGSGCWTSRCNTRRRSPARSRSAIGTRRSLGARRTPSR
jgi:hypothetical protein